jgi:hypothetical protein
MTYMTAGTTPKWADVHDFTDDSFSDIWKQETDPEAERGEVAVAFFSEEFYPFAVTMLGASIEDNSSTIYRDREWLVKMIGHKQIARYEAEREEYRLEYNAQNGSDDTLYDEWKEAL